MPITAQRVVLPHRVTISDVNASIDGLQHGALRMTSLGLQKYENSVRRTPRFRVICLPSCH